MPRISFRLPEDLLQALDKYAAEEKLSRSQFLMKAARFYRSLPEGERQRLARVRPLSPAPRQRPAPCPHPTAREVN
jgi:metal-responsive CopG/Arc/MetJ family transcriptional regulator